LIRSAARRAGTAATHTRRARRSWLICVASALALVADAGWAAQAAANAAAAPASAPVRRVAHPKPLDALDSRVQLMTRELDLDATQQTQLRAILQAHRAEVAKAWSDPAVPASVRVGATQAIAERTSDRIRAMLNEAQREKYMKAHEHEAPVGAPGGDVQRWMKSAQLQEQAPNAATASAAVAKGK
jgi:Spy/CpxP family protein refolding chaperone